MLKNNEETYLFTGDTPFVRGTGRTDCQNGNPESLYESLFDTLLKFPEESIVYPGHDYSGRNVSTIAEEKAIIHAYNLRKKILLSK